MLMTGRQASRLLRDVLSSDQRARLLLRSGIIGDPIVTPHGPVFDAPAVDALRHRPAVDERELAHACPHGIWLTRLPRSATLDLGRSWHDVASQVSEQCARQRPLTAWSAALLAVRLKTWGPLPFVATFLGYVVFTANLVRLTERGPQLEPPGGWSNALEGRRWHTPRGGRPHVLWTPPV